MSIWRDRISNYKENKERVERGEINCIPCPFERYTSVFPGIQQAKYYGITGSQKAGKSQLALYMFCLQPLLYSYLNPGKIEPRILYFSLEMGINQLWDRIIGWWLYITFGTRVPDIELNSLNVNNPLRTEVLDKMSNSNFTGFLDYIDRHLTVYEHIRHPTGIYKECINVSNQTGTVSYKDMNWVDNTTGEITKKRVIDKYSFNSPNQYNILIVDHISLLTPEKSMGGEKSTLYNTIGRFSSYDCVYLRNVYKWTICNIQQQSLDKESNDSFKLGRLAPTSDGLADNKGTCKDRVKKFVN